MKYMLDTNICIYAIKNKPEKVLENRRGGPIWPPAGRSGTGPYEKNASAPLFVVGAGPRPARQPSPLGEGAERMRGG